MTKILSDGHGLGTHRWSLGNRFAHRADRAGVLGSSKDSDCLLGETRLF